MTPGVAAAKPLYVTDAADSAAVSLWLFAVAILVVLMVAVGGATRLTDSGLSITEWKPLLGAIPPLNDLDWQDAFAKYKAIPEYKLVNEGMSLAAFKTIYWWEWGHRFLGRFIGLAYALPLLVFWLSGAVPSRLKAALVAVLLLGGLQGFVGWYMVQSGLTERVDVSQYRLAMHLGLAFIILGSLTWLACSARPVDPMARLQSVPKSVCWSALVLLLLLFVQVVLGAFVAGTKAGLTYNTWPLMDGDLVPPGLWALSPWYINLFENITAIQFNHRVTAYVLLALGVVHVALVMARTENTSVRLSALFATVLLFAQAGLGIWTLLAAEGAIPIGLGITHQTLAAVLLAVMVWHVHTAWHAARA